MAAGGRCSFLQPPNWPVPGWRAHPDPRRHTVDGTPGRLSLGVLNIQQREGEATTGANFTALRLRRDVLANSDIGAILLNKEENGPHFNRGWS